MRVIVAFALEERVEYLRPEVRKYLRQQGVAERPLASSDRDGVVTTYGSFERGLAALEASRTLRRDLEAIVGPAGLSRLVVTVHAQQEAAPHARLRLRRPPAEHLTANCR